MRDTGRHWMRGVLMAAGVATAALAATIVTPPAPAHAQFFGDTFRFEPWGAPRPPSRGFYFPFFSRRPPPPRPESYRAPPPRKLATTPSKTVLVIGDSMADWLGYGLEEVYADSPDIGIVRKIKPTIGLVRAEPRTDTPEWLPALKEILASEQPSAIVVMLGLRDRLPLRERPPPPPAEDKHDGTKPEDKQRQAAEARARKERAEAAQAAAAAPGPGQAHPVPGVTYEFRTEQWAELYGKRIDAMIAALKSKGVPVLWVGLPAIRGPRATSDMSYLDDLYRAHADKGGIDYVDIWNSFVDEDGRYVVEGPDFEGQTRRLRTADGIHFTKYGAIKLAHLVNQDLRRLLASRPLASLTAPQANAPTPAQKGTARPAVGPVLPLASTGYDSGSDERLAGGSRGQPAVTDPIAERALVRGDALAAPAGRADNFAWPPDPQTDPQTPAQAAAPSSGAATATPPH